METNLIENIYFHIRIKVYWFKCCSQCFKNLNALKKLLFYVADDQLSVQVDESGWAWLVHKERLIIWKIGQSAIAKVTEGSRWKVCILCYFNWLRSYGVGVFFSWSLCVLPQKQQG